MQAKDLIVSGASRFLNTINGNITGTASNVTGTVAIANGGTGATSRLGAAKNLTDETVPTPGFVVGLTDSWGKFGYTSIANLKTTIGSAAAASGGTAITMCTTGEKYTWNNKSNLTIGTTASTAMAGNTNVNNVTQSPSTTNGKYEVLLSGTADNTEHTESVKKSNYFRFNPGASPAPALEVIYGIPDGNSDTTVITGKSITISSNMDPGSMVVNHTDITSDVTWDGTNTSLKTAITQLKNNKADILAETIASLTFSSGVATLAKKTGYILINIYPYNRSDNIYGITSFTEQTDGSYKIRNNTTNLSANLAARAIWLKV